MVLVKDVSLILERCKKVHKHVTLRVGAVGCGARARARPGGWDALRACL